MPRDRPAPLPSQRVLGVRLLGTGRFVPGTPVTNDDLGRRFHVDPAALECAAGVRARHHAADHQATSDLAAEAVQRCLARAGVGADRVDLLLMATASPDMSFPSVSCQLQDRFRMRCAAVDLQAGAAGFLHALVAGASFVASGASDYALIVGAECLSRMLPPDDPPAWARFGDGAGAALLGRGNAEHGIVGYHLGADPFDANALHRPGCGSRQPPTAALLGAGDQYLRGRLEESADAAAWSASTLLDVHRRSPSNVQVALFPQTTTTGLRQLCEATGLRAEQVQSTFIENGYTLAAGAAMALDEAVHTKRLTRDGLILLSGFGPGFSWGTLLFQL